MKVFKLLNSLLESPKVNEEFGKALFNLANLLGIVVLFNYYWDSDNPFDLIIALFVLIFFYLSAMIFIRESEKRS